VWKVRSNLSGLRLEANIGISGNSRSLGGDSRHLESCQANLYFTDQAMKLEEEL
jgi:hypothetical protein